MSKAAIYYAKPVDPAVDKGLIINKNRTRGISEHGDNFYFHMKI